ncbi:MAG: GNAT family N-acetyltransferase [Clostridia bacterium]|nr:GNAT family N-acetyltransferase [Clostridia bacterium]
MDVRIFPKLPVYAVDIRNEVFVKEQGFKEEFDTADKTAIHLVGFENDRSVATSRVIRLNDTDYIIGRIAVRRAYRKLGYGAEIVYAAEEHVRSLGGKTVYIHSQEQASGFYERIGYTRTGETDFEEGCPHVMMIKQL